MVTKIDLDNFRVVKFGNVDIERNYINDILHALNDKIKTTNSGSGIASVRGDNTTTRVDNTDPLNPVVSAQLALNAAKAYTDAAVAAGGTNIATIRRIGALRGF